MFQIRRRKDKTLSVRLGFDEALVLKSLPGRLRKLLEDPEFNERVTARLFPRAYDDEKEDAEYRRLLGDDLLRRKLEGIEAFETSLHDLKVQRRFVEIRVRPEDFDLWLGFVNDMRLVLGIELDIRDDDWGREFDFGHPRAEDLALLHFLTWFEEELLRASGFRTPKIHPNDL